jgi:hypothetical protein
MKRISSKFTWFHKVAFPFVWFGFMALFVGIALVSEAGRKDPMLLVVPLAMGGVGFFIMKKLVWDLVDEVYDGGDYLVVKDRGREDRIAFGNIMHVNATSMTNPVRITLRLVTPCLFGSEVTFSPLASFTLNPLARNPIMEDLIVRVDRARRKGGR